MVTDYSSYLEAKTKMTVYMRYTWVHRKKKDKKIANPGIPVDCAKTMESDNPC